MAHRERSEPSERSARIEEINSSEDIRTLSCSDIRSMAKRAVFQVPTRLSGMALGLPSGFSTPVWGLWGMSIGVCLTKEVERAPIYFSGMALQLPGGGAERV